MALDLPVVMGCVSRKQTYEKPSNPDSTLLGDHAVILRSRAMRLPTLLMAALVLGSPIGAHAQADLVNCEDFGFNAPMSCLDGAQPTAGPAPSEDGAIEPVGPYGWDFGSEPELSPGLLMPF